MFKKVTIFVLLLSSFALSDIDFCNSVGLCKKGTTHICCITKGVFAPHCSRGIQLLQNTKEGIATILDEHNKVREAVASGKQGFAKAANIPILTWSDELAYTAECHVKACIEDHDKCRNTENFQHVRQNLYSAYSPAPYSFEVLYARAVTKWAGESKKTHQKHLINYDGTSGIGHFTLIVHETANKVGCAAASWKIGDNTHYQVTCNYNGGNMMGRRVYQPGNLNCTTGTSTKYPHLCSKNEPPISV